jgi:hypothetical protein
MGVSLELRVAGSGNQRIRTKQWDRVIVMHASGRSAEFNQKQRIPTVFYRLGLTVISTSWPSAIKKSISVRLKNCPNGYASEVPKFISLSAISIPQRILKIIVELLGVECAADPLMIVLSSSR